MISPKIKAGNSTEMTDRVGCTIMGVDEQNPDFLAFRATLSMAQESWERALEDLNRDVNIENNTTALSCRAKVHTKQNSLDLALQDYTRVLTIKTRDAYMLTMRGKVHLKGRNFDLAAADFHAAIDVQKPLHYTTPMHYLGNIYLKRREWDMALALYQGALDVNEHLCGSLVGKAIALYHKKQYEKAMAAAKKTLVHWSANSTAFAIIGAILAKQGNFKESFEKLDKALQINPKNLFALSQMGLLQFLMKLPDDALQTFNHVLEKDPQDVFTLSQRGNLYFQARMEKEAMADFKQVIALDPDNIFAWTRQIELLKRAGRLAEANPRDELLRARVLGLKGDLQSALNIILKASSGNKLALQQKADIYLHTEQYELALAYYHQLIALDPYNAAPYFGISFIYFTRLETTKAYKIVEEGEKFDPYYLSFLTYENGEGGRSIFSLADY